jgi:abequosyltransferase
MNSVRLSICMPTYNFGRFIGEALDSILKQATDEVEIVVLDGASTDNTSEVVGGFQARFPRLYYHRLASRGGIDRDMARSVELANGEYCWLFSSDDVMREGALRDVLEEINLGFDLYLCGLTLCTHDMQPITQQRVLSLPSDAEFELANEEDRLCYFRLAETTTAFFSFMGSLIVRRSRWNAIPFDESFDGTLWAHVARIFAMIPHGLRLKYLSHSYLYKRCGDSDSFMDKGPGHRYKLGIEGYDRLADAFFTRGSVEASAIRRAVRNEFPSIGALLNFKLANIRVNKDDILLLDRLAATVYRERPLIARAPFLIYRMTPLPLARAAYIVYKALKPRLRMHKSR